MASGRKDHRPGLDACLKALRQGDTLVVWKLDRLGRDLKHLVTLVDMLRVRNIGFKVLAGHGAQIDATTSNGKLVFGIFATLAEYERELIVERTHAGLNAARARGRLGGRPRKMDRSTLLMAMSAMADPKANAAEVSKRLGITTTTLYTYPEVELDIALCDRTVDLIEEGFEAAIRFGSLPDSGLIARPLMPYRMMICASPDYIARHGKPQRPEDLSEHHCIAFRYSAGSAWRMTNDEGSASVQVSCAIQVNNGQAIRVAALNGLGVVMQPEVLMAQDVAAGRLVRLLPNYELPSRPMHIVCLRDQHMSPKLRSFVDFVVERFGSIRS
jgi:hypothetical protein